MATMRSTAHCLPRTYMRRENTSPRRKYIHFRSDRGRANQRFIHVKFTAERLIDRIGRVRLRCRAVMQMSGARRNFIASLAKTEPNRTNLRALNHRYAAENKPPNCSRGGDSERACHWSVRAVLTVLCKFARNGLYPSRAHRTAGASLHALLRVSM